MTVEEIEHLRQWISNDSVGFDLNERHKQFSNILHLIDDHAKLMYACKYALRFFEEYDVENQFHPSLKQILRAAVATQSEEKGS